MTSSKETRFVTFAIRGATPRAVDEKILRLCQLVNEESEDAAADRSISADRSPQRLREASRRIFTDDQPRRIRNPRPIPDVHGSGWPLLKDKPKLPAARKPDTVTLYGMRVNVLRPRTAAYLTAAVGVALGVNALTGLYDWHLFLCCYLIVGFWVLCGITNMQARWIQKTQETYLQQLAEAGARDAGAHNPHDLR